MNRPAKARLFEGVLPGLNAARVYLSLPAIHTADITAGVGLPPAPVADADPVRTLAAVRATVAKLSAPGHALRRALHQLQTLDLVRTIEGGAGT